MPTTTSVLVTTSLRDVDKIRELNQRVEPDGYVDFVSCLDVDPAFGVDRTYGGDAPISMNVAVGAVRALSLPAVILSIRRIAWERPDAVQLFVCGEEGMWFTEVDWRHYPDALLHE